METLLPVDRALAQEVRNLLPPESPLVLAVSGGRDSMALMHFLHEHGWSDVLVAHLDHGLRGAASSEDAAFVEESASALGLVFQGARVDVGALATASKESVEEVGREVRYRWLAELADELSEARGGLGVPVVTAHQADDQAETVLIHLFRGAGLRGLAGMARRSRLRIGGRSLEVVRPFLSVLRCEIDRYLAAQGIRWREDDSNEDPKFLRNRVRHRLLPALEEVFARDVRPALWRAAALARMEEAWAAEALGELPRRGEGLDLAAIRAMPEGQRCRALLAWLREQAVPDCGYAEVARLEAIALSAGRPSRTSLPGGWSGRRRAGVLFLEPPSASPEA